MSVEFLLTSLIVAAIPGTGVVYTISSSIGGGWRGGLLAAIGCTLGILPHILAAMLGLSAIMQAGSAVFEVVRWAGVAYLVYMGVAMIREGGVLQLDQDRDASMCTKGLVIRRGILLNILNPDFVLLRISSAVSRQPAGPNRCEVGRAWRGLHACDLDRVCGLCIRERYRPRPAARRSHLPPLVPEISRGASDRVCRQTRPYGPLRVPASVSSLPGIICQQRRWLPHRREVRRAPRKRGASGRRVRLR